GGRLSTRKEVLCVVACCRRTWPPLDGAGAAALEALERYADGHGTREEAERSAQAGPAALSWLGRRLPVLASDYAQDWAVQSGHGASAVALTRDLFNPFRPAGFAPAS